MRLAAAVFGVLLCAACAPFVPVQDLSKVPQETKDAAAAIPVFTVGMSPSNTKGMKTLGPVEGYSCKHLLTDPPPSKGEAMTRMRLEALKAGANAVTDVSFDSARTDAIGTNCWASEHASGMAVVLPQQ